MGTNVYAGRLEIDSERGVIYFHSEGEITLLRIQGLPGPIPQPVAGSTMLDLNFMAGMTSWGGRVPGGYATLPVQPVHADGSASISEQFLPAFCNLRGKPIGQWTTQDQRYARALGWELSRSPYVPDKLIIQSAGNGPPTIREADVLRYVIKAAQAGISLAKKALREIGYDGPAIQEISWTEEDTSLALEQGWAMHFWGEKISIVASRGTHRFFEDDQAAFEWVQKQAKRPAHLNPPAVKAIAILERRLPFGGSGENTWSIADSALARDQGWGLELINGHEMSVCVVRDVADRFNNNMDAAVWVKIVSEQTEETAARTLARKALRLIEAHNLK